jgi:hypothetical protein
MDKKDGLLCYVEECQDTSITLRMNGYMIADDDSGVRSQNELMIDYR